MPTHTPGTAAIVGFFSVWIARAMRLSVCILFLEPVTPPMPMLPTSTPEQKSPPAPVRIAARTV